LLLCFIVVKNATYYVQMCKKLQLLENFFPRPPLEFFPWTIPYWGTSDPLAALSGNESLCFSLCLCFSNDVCSAPNSWRIRNQKHRFMAGRHWQKFWSQFVFTV